MKSPANAALRTVTRISRNLCISPVGTRALFPLVSDAVKRVMPLDRLRWTTCSHVEADECGALNAWLAAAPNAEVVHGRTACMVSLNDLADRPLRHVAHFFIHHPRLDIQRDVKRLFRTNFEQWTGLQRG